MLGVFKRNAGAGEMAQQLRTLTVLPKVLSSNPSNHMVAHNHLYCYSVLIYINLLKNSFTNKKMLLPRAENCKNYHIFVSF